MNALSLGDAIRQLRDNADLSLRELAGKAKISPPHLSDIELGKRYPSDEVLQKLSKHLKTSFEDLKKYDNRSAVSDIKRIMQAHPNLGFALRSATDMVRRGELSADELTKRLTGESKKR